MSGRVGEGLGGVKLVFDRGKFSGEGGGLGLALFCVGPIDCAFGVVDAGEDGLDCVIVLAGRWDRTCDRDSGHTGG